MTSNCPNRFKLIFGAARFLSIRSSRQGSGLCLVTQQYTCLVYRDRHALVHILGGKVSVLSQFPIYLVCSITLATVFCIAVEEPFTRFGRNVTRWSNNRRALSLAPSGIRQSGESLT